MSRTVPAQPPSSEERSIPGASVGVAAASPAILGESPAIVRLRRDLTRIARSAASTVAVLGESGTGKELVARALHDSSARADRAFVAVNCSAVPATLLEAEFFGHEAGAFTDARTQKPGLLESAVGGTFFLDEVGLLELPVQAKFLRFLEERTIRRLGGTREVGLDVRFVAATNVDLEEMVRAGTFRADLYYRLQVVTLRIPPLRDRLEDVPLLARHFLELYSRRFHKAFTEFSVPALELLQAHNWPGNVRELRNAIERVVLLEDGPVVEAEALVLGPRRAADLTPLAELPESDSMDLAHLERNAIARAFERSGSNLSAAARLLGISRDALRYRLEKYGGRLETRVVFDEAAG